MGLAHRAGLGLRHALGAQVTRALIDGIMDAADERICYDEVLKVLSGGPRQGTESAPALPASAGIGEKIRQDRLRLGWTLEQTAQAAQLSSRTLWKYESQRLPESRMAIPILKRLGQALAQREDAYLNDYHRWVLCRAPEDVGWLMEHHHWKSLDELARACHASHRSLYQWREGIGQPNEQTWQVVMQERQRHCP